MFHDKKVHNLLFVRKTLLERLVRNNSPPICYLACYHIPSNQVEKPFQMKYCVLLHLKCDVIIILLCSRATKSPVSSLMFILIVSKIFFFVQRDIMWPFKVLANITSMISLYCNSTKNWNNNITMMLALNDIAINIKILISSFGQCKGESFLSEALTDALSR